MAIRELLEFMLTNRRGGTSTVIKMALDGTSRDAKVVCANSIEAKQLFDRRKTLTIHDIMSGNYKGCNPMPILFDNHTLLEIFERETLIREELLNYLKSLKTDFEQKYPSHSMEFQRFLEIIKIAEK